MMTLLFQQTDSEIKCRVDYVLKAVVTYTEKLALEQAAAADELLDKGVYLGNLSYIFAALLCKELTR